MRENAARNKTIRDTFIQAVLYLGAFYVTWLLTIAIRIYFFVHHHLPIKLTFASAVYPLQGALNVLIYMRKELFSTTT